MDTLLLCLAIMLCLNRDRGDAPPAREALPPLLGLVGAVGLAGATFCAVFLPTTNQDCGGLYNPCMMMGKWTLVAVMGVPALACITVSLVLAWVRASRVE
ncbi:hypothetical protein ACXIVK_27890 [Paraburkholderia caledonica]|jgi:hypothetical protein